MPFPITHAGGGAKYFAFANDYTLIDFSLKFKFKKPLFSKYQTFFVAEFLENIEESSDNKAWAAKLVIGKPCSKKGDLQLITSYDKIEAKSIIGYYTPYGRTVNSKGSRINLNIGVNKNITLTLCYANLEKENRLLPGPYNKFTRKLLMTTVKF